MYIYESHLGSFYSSEQDLDYDDLYCESCGDSDMSLGWFNSREEVREMLEDYYDYNKPCTQEIDFYATKEEFAIHRAEVLKDIEKQLNNLWYE